MRHRVGVAPVEELVHARRPAAGTAARRAAASPSRSRRPAAPRRPSRPASRCGPARRRARRAPCDRKKRKATSHEARSCCGCAAEPSDQQAPPSPTTASTQRRSAGSRREAVPGRDPRRSPRRPTDGRVAHACASAHAVDQLDRAAPRAGAAARRRRRVERGSQDSIEMKKRVVARALEARASRTAGGSSVGSWLSANMPNTAPSAPPSTAELEGDRDEGRPAEERLAADRQRVGDACAPRPGARSRRPRRRSAMTSTIHGSIERLRPIAAVEPVHRERRVRVPARVAGVAHALAGVVERAGVANSASSAEALAGRQARLEQAPSGRSSARDASRARARAVRVRVGLRQHRLHLGHGDHRQEAHEQAEHREEQAEAAEQASRRPRSSGVNIAPATTAGSRGAARSR